MPHPTNASTDILGSKEAEEGEKEECAVVAKRMGGSGSAGSGAIINEPLSHVRFQSSSPSSAEMYHAFVSWRLQVSSQTSPQGGLARIPDGLPPRVCEQLGKLAHGGNSIVW